MKQQARPKERILRGRARERSVTEDVIGKVQTVCFISQSAYKHREPRSGIFSFCVIGNLVDTQALLDGMLAYKKTKENAD